MSFFQTLGSFVGSALPGTQGWGTAIGSGLGSFADTMFQEGISDANDREVRQWQEAMYDKQFQNNKEFWYEQQQYNSPKNQVERLQEAGIHPAFAIGNIQSGQMGSVGSSSVPSGSVSQRVTPQRLNSTLEGLLTTQYQRLGQKETVRGLELDNQAKEIDNSTKAMLNMISLWQMITQGNKNISSAYKDYNDMEISNFLAWPQAQELLSKALNSYSESELNTIDAMRSWKELEYLPYDKAIQYQSAIAEINLKYQEGRLTKQQTLTEIQKTNGEYFRNKGQKFMNSLNEKCEKAFIEKNIQETLPALGKFGENSGDWTGKRKYGEYPKP